MTLALFDESDSDIESEYSDIVTERNILNQRISQLDIFEKSVSDVKMVDKTIRDQKGIPQTTYSQPKNIARNNMDDTYRTSEKAQLITNIQNTKVDNPARSYYKELENVNE